MYALHIEVNVSLEACGSGEGQQRSWPSYIANSLELEGPRLSTMNEKNEHFQVITSTATACRAWLRSTVTSHMQTMERCKASAVVRQTCSTNVTAGYKLTHVFKARMTSFFL